jgi:voltage-gated potassium channel
LEPLKKYLGLKKYKKLIDFLDASLLILILINVLAVIYETVDGLYQAYKVWFDGIEVFSISVFTVEYICRLIFSVHDKRFRHPWKGRLNYALTPMALIDLFSILPFYLPFIFPFDLRFIRIIRLLRVFRILKVAHYSKKLALIIKVIHSKRHELGLTFLLAVIVLVINSCMMYFAEHETQPVAFPDIPTTIWWCFMTLSTIGYHDIIPMTSFGKFIHVVNIFVGIGLFALPAGILGEGFVSAIAQENKKKKG